MGVRKLFFSNGRPGSGANHPAARFVPVSQLRRLRECVQVAAICYRVNRKGIEFLLVQTRGSGLWTFPKGGIEPGLTHAQAAALEAFEEAGVHGRMEEASFARYVRTRRNRGKNSKARIEAINAHLCEVLWLGPPEESGRNPSWFSPEKAKRRLRQNRAFDFAAELAGVVERAVARIQRLRSSDGTAADALQKVRFEAFEGNNGYGRTHEASFSRYGGAKRGDAQQSAAIKLAVHAHLSQVLQFVRPQELNQDAGLLPCNEEDGGLVRTVDSSATRIPQLLSAVDPGNANQSMDITAPDHFCERSGKTKIAAAKTKNGGCGSSTMQS